LLLCFFFKKLFLTLRLSVWREEERTTIARTNRSDCPACLPVSLSPLSLLFDLTVCGLADATMKTKIINKELKPLYAELTKLHKDSLLDAFCLYMYAIALFFSFVLSSFLPFSHLSPAFFLS
jgi:hypothetical protein